jgi:death-on-curing family protein
LAPIAYPTVDELIETNRRALIEIRSKKADSHRVLSRRLLNAALERVEAESGDLYDKAAVLLTELVRAHAFASGVRRTAYAATMAFLRTNGQHPRVFPDAKILTGVREGFYAQDEIKEWLKGNAIRKFTRS